MQAHDPYDFSYFLGRMIPLSYAEILLQAERECSGVERTLFGVKGGPKRREQGGVAYVEKIKAFRFFMRHGARPGGASATEFAAYQPVVKALVERGEFKPEALALFARSAA